MGDYDMGIEPPLESPVPCCTYLRAFVRSKDYNYIINLCRELSLVNYPWAKDSWAWIVRSEARVD